jgi:N6-adenosine-specific RNA methylase IME4
VQQKGLRLDFQAKVEKHSKKPQAFYDLVKQASPAPRLELFAREPREGFEVWGNEIGRSERLEVGRRSQESDNRRDKAEFLLHAVAEARV